MSGRPTLYRVIRRGRRTSDAFGYWTEIILRRLDHEEALRECAALAKFCDGNGAYAIEEDKP